MRNRGRSISMISLGAILLGGGLLTGCTGSIDPPDQEADPTAPSSAPTPATISPTPAPTAQALSATDPGAPFNPADLKRWSDRIDDEIETRAGLDSSPSGIVVHLDAGTSQNHLVALKSLAPGNYTYYFTCRGGGSLSIEVTTGGADGELISGPCDNGTVSGEFVAADGGTEFSFDADGDPIDVALSYVPVTP